MSKARSGGGITGKNVVHTKDPRTPKPTSRAINPGGVAQIGTALGNHVMGKGQPVKGAAVPLDAGRGYQGPKGPSDNVAAVGGGGGRTVYGTGTQATHGPVVRTAPAPTLPRDVHGFVGPERGEKKGSNV